MSPKVAIFLVSTILAFAIVVAIFVQKAEVGKAQLAAASEQAAAANAESEKLREQFKKFDGLVPDQAAIMTHVGYHFTNLWFAIDQENWPLADFYLGEARANIKWAVRAKPIRKGPDGKEFDLGAIAQALDNTNLAGLKTAIDAKQKAQFAAQYTETLGMCYACHKASGKPYLRPQIPTSPEVRIINLDPNAKTPQ